MTDTSHQSNGILTLLNAASVIDQPPSNVAISDAGPSYMASLLGTGAHTSAPSIAPHITKRKKKGYRRKKDRYGVRVPDWIESLVELKKEGIVEVIVEEIPKEEEKPGNTYHRPTFEGKWITSISFKQDNRKEVLSRMNEKIDADATGLPTKMDTEEFSSALTEMLRYCCIGPDKMKGKLNKTFDWKSNTWKWYPERCRESFEENEKRKAKKKAKRIAQGYQN
jgi:hypothetical protein